MGEPLNDNQPYVAAPHAASCPGTQGGEVHGLRRSSGQARVRIRRVCLFFARGERKESVNLLDQRGVPRGHVMWTKTRKDLS